MKLPDLFHLNPCHAAFEVACLDSETLQNFQETAKLVDAVDSGCFSPQPHYSMLQCKHGNDTAGLDFFFIALWWLKHAKT